MAFGRPSPEELRERAEARKQANLRGLIAGAQGRVSRGVYGARAAVAPIAKERASQHAGYMDAVRSLCQCVRCGRTLPRAVFCHRDMGKGIGIKTDVREGWAGCDDCHYLVGTSGTLAKPVRRAVELLLAAITRALVIEAGTWPKPLPLWQHVETGGEA